MVRRVEAAHQIPEKPFENTSGWALCSTEYMQSDEAIIKRTMMNKEEILAKSRAENKGQDEREKQVLIKAGQIAFTVGGVMCMLIALFNSILSMVDHGGTRFDPKLNTLLWAIYLSMLGSLFLYKYIKLKKKHELFLAIALLTVSLAGLVWTMLKMIGVL